MTQSDETSFREMFCYCWGFLFCFVVLFFNNIYTKPVKGDVHKES